MRDKLEKLLKNSYSPYSEYPVSCIIVTKDNKEFSGVNIENASYGATICAERSAISGAISSGYKEGDFKEIHIMNKTEKIGFPCFICRQVLIEFMNDETKVYLYTKDNEKCFTLDELTPHKFDKDSL